MIHTKNIPNDLLEKTIKESYSWSEAMRKLNKPTKGASYQFFQNRVKKLGIDTSHFLGKAAHTGERHTGKCKTKHWSDILKTSQTKERVDSKQLRRSYKKYCDEMNIKQQCVHCGNEGIWLNQKMLLQIDHIDGNRGNNHPSNLQLLCANCHVIKTYPDVT
jgi:5-methylcytosine-specific restriction endonuclease McrA